ncbi:MAG: flippase-like domain-containing protein [Desulfobulbaceae bacterium]
MAIERLSSMITRQNILYFLFSALVTAGIFTYLFTKVSLAEVIDLLRGISFRWVVLFLLLSFSMSLFRAWRSQLVLGASGYHPNTIALFLIILVRNFFSDLLPARLGTLIYIYLVQTRLGIAFGPAASSFAYDFVFDMVSLALLIILAVMMQTSTLIPSATVISGGIVLGAVSMGILLVLPALLRFMARMCLSVPLLSQRLRQRFHDALVDTGQNMMLAREQGIYWRIFALSLGVRCCKYLSLYVLLLALVLPLGFTVLSFPLPKVFLGLCSAELAASLPISGIAGFGVYEGAWTLVFQLLGYSERIAALTSISHHLLTQVYGYSLGALALLVLLLPVFKRETKAEAPGKRVVGRMFWLQFAGVVAVILSGFLFLFPGQGEGVQPAPREPEKSIVSPDKVEAREAGKSIVSPDYGEKVRGKVVYQRPDGIYLLDLRDKTPKRLVPYGTYPRWSPDGGRFVFVHGNDIVLADAEGREVTKIAVAERARAVCFAPDGRSVLFSDGRFLKKVEVATGRVTTLLQNNEFREFDLAPDGKRLAATVRTLLGTKVLAFDLAGGRKERTVANNGCSASLSPDGQLITVNGASHKKLDLYDWQTLRPAGAVSAPAGLKFDNQFWSNHPEWLVSTSEGRRQDIYLHHFPSNTASRATATGDCDRADLFVEFTP